MKIFNADKHNRIEWLEKNDFFWTRKRFSLYDEELPILNIDGENFPIFNDKHNGIEWLEKKLTFWTRKRFFITKFDGSFRFNLPVIYP